MNKGSRLINSVFEFGSSQKSGFAFGSVLDPGFGFGSGSGSVSNPGSTTVRNWFGIVFFEIESLWYKYISRQGRLQDFGLGAEHCMGVGFVGGQGLGLARIYSGWRSTFSKKFEKL